MKITILIEQNKFSKIIHFKSRLSIYVSGYFWIQESFYSGENAIEFINNLTKKLDILNIIDFIKNLNGHYYIIINNDNYLLAFVDRIRSIPLFFNITEDNIKLSNEADKLLNKDNSEIDDISLNEFKLAGYTLNDKTLYKAIKQIKPGEYFYINKETQKLKLEYYYRYFPTYCNEEKIEHRKEKLNDILHSIFKRLIISIQNRQVCVPLSRGYDSRLILSMLLKYGYSDIITYSYGPCRTNDVKGAKEIAKKLKVKWFHIALSKNDAYKIYNSEEHIKYLKYASNYCSIPHLADLITIPILRKRVKLNEDAIFINGQSGDFISGGHIPNIKRSQISIVSFVEMIMEKHFSLWYNLRTESTNNYIKKYIIEAYLKENTEMICREIAASLYENFEYEERQSKFVVNGQRIYEWLGYDWRLPLWDYELIDFFQNIKYDYKINQKIYKETLHEFDYMKIFNMKLPKTKTYAPYNIVLLNKVFALFDKLGINNYNHLVRKYSLYFMHYSPFYPVNYREYILDSQYHRNAVSYWTKKYLNLLNENRFCI